MAFLRSRAINLLNLHYAIHTLALTGGAAFFAVYLFHAGFSVPAMLAAIAAIYAVRFVIRPSVGLLAPRWGLRAFVIIGTLLSAAQYLFLAEVTGLNGVLIAFILVSAAGETIYWTSYHAYFALLGDDEHRGHQVGAREAAAAIVGIVSPLATGWLLVQFGPLVSFGFSSLATGIAAVPLLFTPDIPVARRVPGAYRAALPGVRLFMCDGWIMAFYVFVWQITLFFSLNADFLAFGGALAFAALAGAVGSLALGRVIDAGHGGRAVWIGCGALATILLLRAAATHDVWLAVAANALGSVANCLYVPTLMTAVYTLAKRAPCATRFQVALEGGWDMGCTGGLLSASLLSWAGTPLPAIIPLSLLGVGAIAFMLRRYYADNPQIRIEPILPEPAIVP